MKVLDLQCRQGHSFEGWFGSQDDYDAQRARGLVTCPMCNDSEITKMLSAPRLNLGHGTEPVQTPAAPEAAAPSAAPAKTAAATAQPLAQMQAALLHMVRHVMANTEDVGTQFAEEARKIHYGEREERNIRGQATREETEALLDEGIDVMPLPVPDALKEPLQ
ncbi:MULTISPECIES: DUF1178 family protein [unclassified Limnohabitans]|uniref:DUF1178 family protein n=1 Tax=unclassified Limnohabitans TaxID=2626134 RepID=UPI000D3C2A13|nr:MULTISPECIES: DUF1178 family protein [unclassified Limnohabitans]PUE19212.1 hypothetical protein B9Z43_11285 [Limnohabitans sp. MMS-10A-192]PUE26043.1 hypothetical protein B9Z38_06910 [Limnohabitans sp. MMS-10A-160]